MISRRRFLSAALAVAFGLGIGGLGAGVARADDTIVFAAVSTKDAMTDIANDFAAAGKGKVVLSFGASGDLAKQIENGAPAGIFISADTKWVDYLDKKKFLVA
ncbi:MAG TPA: molybdate ABC transporter substrate-binding protein, partial [Dongiaceae bacterium]|nr:molybdate ABC transporter substrate-binding protein [Dongiaceae bacterium]